jgi:signal transduction histidine kinase
MPEMAKAIAGRRARIVERWRQRVTSDSERRGHAAMTSDLRDAVGDYLARLSASRALEADSDADASARGAQAWREVAREHALTSVRVGFDVGQLVRELVLLREVIFETVAAEASPPDGFQASRLAAVMEAAIGAVVQAYVEARDHAASAEHEQHVGWVTHELRNPLTTAKIAASQLRNDVHRAPATVRLLDALDRALARMQRLVNDVLLTQRLRRDDVQSQAVDVQLGPIMDDAIRAALHDAQAKRIHFETRFDPDLLLHVDPTLAISAIQNVVDNAIKFTDEGAVQVEVEDRGGEVAVHVRDGCSGLSRDEVAAIFEPSRRRDANKPGTGLGMLIARRAVEAMGGAITVESVEAAGCHFCLTLPKSRH